MEYKSRTLILDNFRSVLKDFSVDIQDVVRSAILDGVDIASYVNLCKNNPYKLDQIRMAMKESIPSVLYDSLSGEQLYIIRQLKVNKYNIDPIVSQVKSGKLAGCYLDFLISWVTKHVDISGIKISLIPKSMLEIFDMHLCQGRNMKPFNNGKVYSKDYILYCLSIQEGGKNIDRFVKEDWDEQLLAQLSVYAGNTPDAVWNSVMSVVTNDTGLERTDLLFSVARIGIPLDKITAVSKKDGSPVYDNESIQVIIDASTQGFDYRKFMSPELSAVQRRAKLDEMKMNRGKKVGGVLRRGSTPKLSEGGEN